MSAEPNQRGALGRGKMSINQRVELLEHDREKQSLVLTGLIDKMGKGFSPEQLAQIRTAMREELADAGLRLDGAEQQDEAREDFRFLRRFRLAWDGSTRKVGTAVLTALIGVALIIFGSGFWQWITSGGE